MNPDINQNTFDLDLRAEQSNFDQALNTSANSEQRSYVFEMAPEIKVQPVSVFPTGQDTRPS